MCNFTVNKINLAQLLLFQLNTKEYRMKLNYQENQLPINRQCICILIRPLNNQMFFYQLYLISPKGLTWHFVLYLKAIFCC